MTKKIIILVFLLTVIEMKSQYYPLDSIIYQEDRLRHLVLIDSFKIETFHNRVNPRGYVSVNNRVIDTLHFYSNYLPIFFNSKLIFNCRDETSECIYYDFSKRSFHSLNTYFRNDNGFLQFFDLFDNKIFIIDPLSGEDRLFYGFDIITEDQSIYDLFFIDNQLTFVEVCMRDPFEACVDLRYYLVSASGANDVTDKLTLPPPLRNIEYHTQRTKINFISMDKKYLHATSEHITMLFSDSREYSRIFNNRFEEIGYVLNRSNVPINGIVYQNGIMQNFLINSFFDDSNLNRKDVWVPYKFNPYLELAMYKAYNNIMLTSDDVAGMGRFELGILRNLIFAKHNYGFNS